MLNSSYKCKLNSTNKCNIVFNIHRMQSYDNFLK